nr:hypothetical protein Iba_chr07eCG8380 [Ipomoea batatas]
MEYEASNHSSSLFTGQRESWKRGHIAVGLRVFRGSGGGPVEEAVIGNLFQDLLKIGAEDVGGGGTPHLASSEKESDEFRRNVDVAEMFKENAPGSERRSVQLLHAEKLRNLGAEAKAGGNSGAFYDQGFRSALTSTLRCFSSVLLIAAAIGTERARRGEMDFGSVAGKKNSRKD